MVMLHHTLFGQELFREITEQIPRRNAHTFMKMPEPSDSALVQRARQGQNAAIGELFSRYWRMARAAAYGVTGDLASAEDAAAEAFQEAIAGIGSLKEPDRFGAWLRMIVVRKARRHTPPKCHALETAHIDPAGRADETLLKQELAAIVRQAIGDLPPLQREAISLIYFEGYEAAAAACFLNIPAGTLRRRLHDGRIRLRSAIANLQHRKGIVNENQIYTDMFDKGEIYQALRGALALRPVPKELINRLKPITQSIPEEFRQLLQPSDHVADPSHPVGRIAAAIRDSLPSYQKLRFTRGLVETGSNQSIYELHRRCPDEETFQDAMAGMALRDAADLTWTVTGELELRTVQEVLEGMASKVLTGVNRKFLPYEEPRYRSALQLQIADVPERAAIGGILNQWSGHPDGNTAAHVRIFLEPWASVQSRTGA